MANIFKKGYKRFKTWRSNRRSRRSSGSKGMSAGAVKSMIAKSNRARERYKNYKYKKTLTRVLIIGAVGGALWFFRDKIKVLLNIQ